MSEGPQTYYPFVQSDPPGFGSGTAGGGGATNPPNIPIAGTDATGLIINSPLLGPGGGSSSIILKGVGNSTNSIGTSAFGQSNTIDSFSDTAFASGNSNTIDTSPDAHVEGSTNHITASFAGHAEGVANTVSAYYAHSEGEGNTSSARSAHSEGGAGTASGQWSHSQNYGCTASGERSNAGGSRSVASGFCSFAFAQDSSAPGDFGVCFASNSKAYYNQFVIGEGAVDDLLPPGALTPGQKIFKIGEGQSVGVPRDIFGVRNNGEIALHESAFAPTGSADARGQVGDLIWNGTALYLKTAGSGWVMFPGAPF